MRPVRLTSSGSFHAGAPIPSFPSPYDTAGSTSGRRRKSLAGLRKQSAHRYHTFPTQPPKTPSDAPDSRAILSPNSEYSDEDDLDIDDAQRHKRRRRRHWHRHTGSRESHNDVTPLPVRQLLLLALLSLCEQTALNSIGPYLPTMVASFPEIPNGQEGLYVGLLASAFALAQLMTNFLWGYFSDRVGRKPVMLLGTALLMACFAFFGFCVKYWQILVVHIAMGLLNGNAAVVPTVLGEVTDRSNQSRAFTWLPVMYSIGGITGPALGGLLVGEPESMAYPFVGPNIMSTALLLLAVIVLSIWFKETLEDVDHKRRQTGRAWAEKVRLCSCFGRTKGKQSHFSPRWLTLRRDSSSWEDASVGTGNDQQRGEGEQQPLLIHPDMEAQECDDAAESAEDSKNERPSRRSALRKLLNWTTLSILFTYLIFQVANISFNSLYPLFASTSPPTGRELGPGTIGVSLSLAGVVTIIFQVFLFERIKARLGNLGTFRLSLLGLAIGMILMPWVGYRDGHGLFGIGSGESWLLGELGVILVLKNLSAVGGLSCVLLLVSRILCECKIFIGRLIQANNSPYIKITNSAPSHETLGTLNGIAQTLSAAGRSFGPFASGALFTLSTHVRPKGELLAWGLFGGVALAGWFWTLSINGESLESADFIRESEDLSEEETSSPL